jgi:hypothetical protein
MFLPALASAEDPIMDSAGIATEDGQASVTVGLDAQARYALEDPSTGAATSEFSLRRLRPIFTFEAFEQISVQIVPEFAGGPELKDGVVAWIPNKWIKLEAGQFAPPFNWERDGSSDYHQFLERSVANDEFQVNDGRDIGVQFDFEWDKFLDVEAGVFNGAGSNERPSPGSGHLFAWRVAFAPFGFYHEVEVLPEIVERPVFMAGVGGFAALNNDWRDWSLPTAASGSGGADDPTSANIWALTADAHVWAWRFSLHGQVFHRTVRPCCSDSERELSGYTGAGFTGQAGFLLIDERLMLAVRHSRSAPDSSRSPLEREYVVVLQAFHRGNESKLTLEAGGVERELPGASDDRWLRLQYQLLL